MNGLNDRSLLPQDDRRCRFYRRIDFRLADRDIEPLACITSGESKGSPTFLPKKRTVG